MVMSQVFPGASEPEIGTLEIGEETPDALMVDLIAAAFGGLQRQ